jgi:hypothetical protein
MKQYLIMAGVALVAVFIANNVEFVGKIVGPKK